MAAGPRKDVLGLLVFSATLTQVLGIRVYLLLFMYDVIKKNGRGTPEGCPVFTGIFPYLDAGPRNTRLFIIVYV